MRVVHLAFCLLLSSASVAGMPRLIRVGRVPRPPQLRLAPKSAALEAYSWSVSRLSASQETVRDAYSWSAQVASNASAVVASNAKAVVEGLHVSQFPAFLPSWLTSRVKRVYSPPEEDAPRLEQEDEEARPSRYMETLVGAGDRLYAIALCVAFVLEMLGPVALILFIRSVASRSLLFGPTAAMLSLPSLRRAGLVLWLRSEAIFYLLCCLVAARHNFRPGSIGPVPFSKSGSPEDRSTLWRRIVRDPSQSPRDFVEGWMYRPREMANASPPQMLLEGAMSCVRSSTSLTPPVSVLSSESSEEVPRARAPLDADGDSSVGDASAGRVMVEPYGVPYEDLSRSDLDHWLCRALFGQQRSAMLSGDEATELAGYVDELEAAVREEGRGAMEVALDLGKGVAGKVSSAVGSAVSESPTVQKMVQTTRNLASKRLDAGNFVSKLQLGADQPTAPTPSDRSNATATASPAELGDTNGRPAGRFPWVGRRLWNITRGVLSPLVRSSRPPTTSGISSLCGSMDALRWRHRPLLFYALTHVVARFLTPMRMRRCGFTRRSQGRITYWHRAGTRSQENDETGEQGSAPAPDAVIFIHGIGFGVAPYVSRVESMGEAIPAGGKAMAMATADILMIELPACSQRAFVRMPPPPEEFGDLVCARTQDLQLIANAPS